MTAAEVSRALQRMGRPAGSFDAQRYSRGGHGLRFYNTGAAPMRALATSIYLAERDRACPPVEFFAAAADHFSGISTTLT